MSMFNYFHQIHWPIFSSASYTLEHLIWLISLCLWWINHWIRYKQAMFSLTQGALNLKLFLRLLYQSLCLFDSQWNFLCAVLIFIDLHFQITDFMLQIGSSLILPYHLTFFLLSTVSSTFLPFFSDFSSVFSYLSIILVCLMACVLITGGFFTMYPVSLCLLSISPLKGHESHLPCIFSFAIYIFNSGSLHFGQRIYLSINLSKTFLRSSSVKLPWIIYEVFVLAVLFDFVSDDFSVVCDAF